MISGTAVADSLIGRGDELAALEAALDGARGGVPVSVLLAGEAGVGKTRLVEEFTGRAYAQGVRVLTGSCIDLGHAALPFGALIDALRGVPPGTYDELSPGLLRQLGALVPELSTDDTATDGGQPGLFGAVLRVIEHLGRQAPVALVLEDVHWADRSTQGILKLLVRGLRQTAVLVVLTYRDDELPREHPMRRLLGELERAPRARSLVLSPLDREQTGRLVAQLAEEPVEARAVDEIFARSEGNPFFIEELLAVRGDAGSLPASLRDALLACLERLPEDARRVARTAAAFGRRVDHDQLEVVADLAEDRLDDALRACVKQNVLDVEPEGRGYRFRHALLEEVAADDLLPGEAARLHDRIADLLEARRPRRGDGDAQHLARVASHRLRGSDPAAGLLAGVRAARAAEQVHALAEAGRNFEAALDLWDRVEDAERLTGVDHVYLLERAAEARAAGLGDTTTAMQLLERAIAELGDEGEPLRRADMLSRLAYMRWDQPARARENERLHEQALGLLGAEPSVIAARVRWRYAGDLMVSGRHSEGASEAAAAAEEARTVGARVDEAEAIITQFSCHCSTGDVDGTIALIEQAREVVRETNAPRLIRRFYSNSVQALYLFGRYEEAVQLGREGIEAHMRAGFDREGQLCVRLNPSIALCVLGRPGEAAELVGEETGADPDDYLYLSLLLTQIAFLQGDLNGATAHLARIGDLAGVHAAIAVPACRLAAEIALWRDDLEAARAAVGIATACASDEDRIDVPPLLATAVRLHVEAADISHADEMLARLERVARTGKRLPEPEAWLLTGQAERGRLGEEPDPARWQAAADAWEALGRPYELGYARWREAQTLANAHAPRPELERALRAAHEAAASVGSLHLVAVVEALARRTRMALPGIGSSAGTAFADLTPREHDVLALVAEGRTNRQIAEELFISGKTASVHVSNILAKLGAANRGEAAAMAHAAGHALRDTVG